MQILTEEEFNKKYPHLSGCWVKEGIFSLGAYLSYTNGATTITLDGEFSATELEQFILYMKDSQL